MFIQTEFTPNPLTLKFIPGVQITENAPVSFVKKDDAITSPLAQNLFEIGEVTGVFFGSDFITITKTEGSDWELLKPQILLTIMEYLNSGRPIFNANSAVNTKNIINDEDSELVKEIKELKELIETRVRPAVAMDGGDIIFKGFEDGIVKLELHGSCSGCPSSTITLKNGIENMLKHYIPEIVAVEAV
ncbi:Fe-S cluster assembly protein NifU [Rickettsiales bacterium Ac37b]|nr:Fe-S cluster assembly protein NifU [Rickettsiales bacterium Ac37b]